MNPAAFGRDLRIESGDPVIVIDAQGRTVDFNEAAEHLTGISRREAIGAPCWEVVAGVDDEGRPVCSRACPILERARRGEPVPAVELLLRTAVGRRRAVVSTLIVTCAGERVVVHVAHAARPAFRPAAEAETHRLTPRQREILRLLAEGLSTQAIAERLRLSPETVKNHVRSVLAALRARSRLEAVAKARRAGLVPW